MTMENSLERQPEEITIDLRYYLYLLRFNWLLLLVVALGAAAIAFTVSYFTPPVYRSTTTLLIDTRGNFASADLNTLRASESLAQTYAELLRSRTVLQQVIDELELDMTVGQLAAAVNATPVANTQLIRIVIETLDGEQSIAIANSLALAFIEQIRVYQSSGYSTSQESLEAQLAYLEGQIAHTEVMLQEATSGTVADTAERNRLDTILADYNRDYSTLLQSYEEVRLKAIEATSNIQQTDMAVTFSKVRPRPSRTVPLAFIFGLLSAIGVVLVREFLDDTVSNPEDLKTRHNLPLVGQILHFDQGADNDRLITVRSPRSPASEAFRALRLNLKYVSVDRSLRTLLVTSASPSEGKTTLSTNLATIMAQSGQSVILMDADWHRPKVHRTFGISNRSGLSDLFVSDLDTMESVAQPTKVDGLRVVAAGSLPPNPAELLDSEKSRQILDNAMEVADFVIVDSPPIFAMTDAAAIAQYVDGVLLVVRAGSTRRSDVAQAVQQLRQVGANLLGFILTDIDDVYRSGRYYYYYRYYYPAYYDNYYNQDGTESGETSDKPSKQKRRSGKKPSDKSRLRQLFNFNR